MGARGGGRKSGLSKRSPIFQTVLRVPFFTWGGGLVSNLSEGVGVSNFSEERDLPRLIQEYGQSAVSTHPTGMHISSFHK